MLRKLLLILPLFLASLYSQNAGLSPYPKLQFFDNNGVACSGCLLYSYLAGTTTPQATYTDSTGSFPNSNPVVADSAGRMSVWLGAMAYKLVLQTSGGSTLWTVDNVVSPVLANYLSLNGGTLAGNVLSSGATNLGNTSNPFGSLFLNQALVMSGSTVVDSGRNATVQNLTINGTCTGCGSVSGFLPLTGGTLTGNLVMNGGGVLFGANTVIDTNRNGTFNNLTITGTCTGCGSGGGGGAFLPLAGGTMAGSIQWAVDGIYNLGNIAAKAAGIYGANFYVGTQVVPLSGGASLGSNILPFSNIWGQQFTGGNANFVNVTITGTCSGCGSGGGGGGGGANTSLSNLTAPTAINTSLWPAASGAADIGAANHYWSNGFFGGQLETSNLEIVFGTPNSITDFWNLQPNGIHILDLKDSSANTLMRFYTVFGVGSSAYFVMNANLYPNGAGLNLGAPGSATTWQTLYLSSGVNINGTAGHTGGTCSHWTGGICDAP
ncbi:MAG TPA: hypothetical protein VKX49_12545 [Bryobacteraceae bacterium]|nr:hypothetical protein [Bryobacteraceae bacterium]